MSFRYLAVIFATYFRSPHNLTRSFSYSIIIPECLLLCKAEGIASNAFVVHPRNNNNLVGPTMLIFTALFLIGLR
jgi:hypothetical protein